MNAIRAIRERLKVSQSELAEALGRTQGNISFYERGQIVPPDVAGKLIVFAASKGEKLGYNDIYSPAEPQPAAAIKAPKRQSHQKPRKAA